jgi:hypothetical protein
MQVIEVGKPNVADAVAFPFGNNFVNGETATAAPTEPPSAAAFIDR